MFDLKPLSTDAIPAALAKAERYRLLNESEMAESICEDILAADPDNRQALVTMILAITDQFPNEGVAAHTARARALLPHLPDEYERLYYAGIICERRARSLLDQDRPGAASAIYEQLREALSWYEEAEARRPAGNDDAILRWNACTRLLQAHPELIPAAAERLQPYVDH